MFFCYEQSFTASFVISNGIRVESSSRINLIMLKLKFGRLGFGELAIQDSEVWELEN